MLYRSGLLFEEAELLLRQELPDPRRYFSVLDAIARGANRNSEISQRTGLSTAQTFQALAMLERLELVEQLRPVTASLRSKKTAYAIRDGFLNFSFRFIEPYRSRLRTNADARRHLDQTVMPNLDAFVSKPAWEQMCQRYVLEHEPEARAVGAWWGTVRVGPKRTEVRELDIVATDAAGAVIALGSCKWTAAPLDYGEPQLLETLAPHVGEVREDCRRYLCSRSGFSDSVQSLAAESPERVRMVGPEDLYA